MYFLHSHITLSFLGANILLRTLFPNISDRVLPSDVPKHPKFMFLAQKAQVSHMDKTTDKTIVLYI
jgi:hypothetical protein